jgi:hypothetical protein
MSEFKYQPEQLKTFWFWINERHAIYVKRKLRKEGPWTKDEILAKYKFTNPFRQLDRVTLAWRSRYVTLLGTDVEFHPKGAHAVMRKIPPTDGDILFHCVMFRLFNWPPTYDALVYSGKPWSYHSAMEILEKRRAEKIQIFTGAYIIPNMGLDTPKIDIIAAAVDLVHENRDAFAKYIKWSRSMEKSCEVLHLVPTIGPFIAYEIICDLRHTRLLADATDAMTWANPGPGAKRGIHRLFSGSPKNTGNKIDYNAVMHDLLTKAKASRSPLSAEVRACEEPFEMREIEHSLCEFDKYMRVKLGEGRPRSLFKPMPPPPWEDIPQTRAEAHRRFMDRMKQKPVKKTTDTRKEDHRH